MKDLFWLSACAAIGLFLLFGFIFGGADGMTSNIGYASDPIAGTRLEWLLHLSPTYWLMHWLLSPVRLVHP